MRGPGACVTCGWPFFSHMFQCQPSEKKKAGIETLLLIPEAKLKHIAKADQKKVKSFFRADNQDEKKYASPPPSGKKRAFWFFFPFVLCVCLIT